MAVAINSQWRIKAFCYQDNQVGINIRYFFTTGVIGAGLSEQQLLDAWSARAAVLYKTWLVDSATFLGMTMSPILTAPPVNTYLSTVGQGPGTVSSDPLPKQIAGIIRLTTGIVGRGNNGRVYVPFPAEAYNGVDNKPTLTALDVLSSIALLWSNAQTFMSGADGVTASPLLFHRVTNTATNIARGVAVPSWATQRRRGDFGRQNPIPF
jgi:hypothetical protein